MSLLRIRIGFNADPDPAFLLMTKNWKKITVGTKNLNFFDQKLHFTYS